MRVLIVLAFVVASCTSTPPDKLYDAGDIALAYLCGASDILSGNLNKPQPASINTTCAIYRKVAKKGAIDPTSK